MNIDLLSESQLATLRALIDGAERIVLCAHQSPDGDALGSTLGMAHWLRTLGKEATVALPDQYPDFLQWMPGAQEIVRFDKNPDRVREVFREAQLVMVMDMNQTSRMDIMEEAFAEAACPLVVIDHHLKPSIDAALVVSYPKLSSASEMVFRVLWQLGAYEAMPYESAVCIYCGIMTDTGAFAYNSNQPEVYFIVSQLLAKGIDKDKIYRNVYWSYSEQRLRMWGYVLYSKMQVLPEYHAAFYSLTKREMKHFRFIKGDAEGLVNMPLQIRGMKLSISLREDTEKKDLVWVSLRSVDDFPCNRMAERYFSGGGHRNASGGRLYCSIEEAEEICSKAIEEFCGEWFGK